MRISVTVFGNLHPTQQEALKRQLREDFPSDQILVDHLPETCLDDFAICLVQGIEESVRSPEWKARLSHLQHSISLGYGRPSSSIIMRDPRLEEPLAYFA